MKNNNEIVEEILDRAQGGPIVKDGKLWSYLRRKFVDALDSKDSLREMIQEDFEYLKKIKNNKEIVTKIREIARPMGWAIGEHGSMVRDIDLIAVPWVQDAKGAFDVFDAIHAVFGGDLRGSTLGNTRLPHGRQALMVIQKGSVSYKGRNGMDDWNPPAIDISFVDPRTFSIQQSEELVRVLEFCDKVISEWFKHGNIEPYSQEQLALDSMRILIKNVLAAHCANQQEDSK